MKLVDQSTIDSETQLAQLLAELAGCIERGDPIDLGVWCSQHPLWAEQFRLLFPVLQRLAVLYHRATG